MQNVFGLCAAVREYKYFKSQTAIGHTVHIYTIIKDDVCAIYYEIEKII